MKNEKSKIPLSNNEITEKLNWVYRNIYKMFYSGRKLKKEDKKSKVWK